MEDAGRFLQDNILHRPVAGIKKFGKGQLPVLCLTLADDNQTKLVVKFYRNRQDMLQSLKIARMFAENSALKCPRLYPLPEEYFCYDGLYGLIYYYISGEEISSAAVNIRHFNQLADMYAVFQNTEVGNTVLCQDRPQNDYLAALRRFSHRLQKIADSKKCLFSKLRITVFLKMLSRFLARIENDYTAIQVPKRKITHNDITKSNLLFKNGNFAAFLDMDSVTLSWPGRDCAEFIVSTVRRFKFWRSRRKAIKQWYACMDKRLHFSREEYLYGLNVYYLYRICNYIRRRRYLGGFLKLYNFAQFIKLHKVIVNELYRLKK